MTIPDELVIYCVVCVLIVVVFCCCFHVIELIKLGYLRRKLISPHRYSLGAISQQFSDVTGDSRLSTRRNSAITAMDDLTPPTTTSNNGGGGGGGNFSIITVFTYASSSGGSGQGQLSLPLRPPSTASEQQKPLAEKSCEVEVEESKEPLDGPSSTCQDESIERTDGYVNGNLMDLMDDPPTYYNALIAK